MNYIHLLRFIPLTAFMLTARLGGMNDLAWKNAFIIGGLCTVLVVTFQLYKNIIVHRLMLGVNLFLLVGAGAFLGNVYSILYYFGAYKGPVFLSCILLVGLFTTLFSSSGFVGVESKNSKKVYKASLQMLLLNFFAIVWSIIMNSYGLIVSVVIPFIGLRIIYDRLGDQIKD